MILLTIHLDKSLSHKEKNINNLLKHCKTIKDNINVIEGYARLVNECNIIKTTIVEDNITSINIFLSRKDAQPWEKNYYGSYVKVSYEEEQG